MRKGEGKTYEAQDDNISRMRKGKAPKGYDGHPVELHHVKGIKNDIDDIVQIKRSDHIKFHKKYGYKDFIDINETDDFKNLIVR